MKTNKSINSKKLTDLSILGVASGRAIRYIFFMAEKAIKKDTAPIPNADFKTRKGLRSISFFHHDQYSK